MRRHDVRQLIVGYAAARPQLLTAAVRKCRRMGLQVSTVPRLYEDVNRRVDVEHIGGIPLLSSRPADPHSWQFSLKYGLDRLIAALLLILLAPLMAVIALAVRLSSPGPILYRQPRVSLDGREFSMLKFRTMHGDEVNDGQQDAEWAAQTVDADARGSTGCRGRPAHAGRRPSCAATRSTSCRSSSTCCSATCRWSARGRSGPPTCSSSASTCTATATATA